MTLLTEHILVAGAVLFAAGMLGFLTRRSLILLFLSLELMLAGVSVNLVAFSRHHDNYQGQVFAILVLSVAACEAALALALIVALYRQRPTLDVKSWQSLREFPGSEPTQVDLDAVEMMEMGDPSLKLTPAGKDPLVEPMPERLFTGIHDLRSKKGASIHD
ncbi:NADH-quinone oxidoreductase subunit NuoK [bacterium]|jgi:NADH-quinone oxidoreductase subunit K|nr:NADH-quinone oxidoreductase subunit NuoK [bacterium]